MKTITALVDMIYVPISDGVREIGYPLRRGQSFQIQTAVWNLQVIAKQMEIEGTISVV